MKVYLQLLPHDVILAKYRQQFVQLGGHSTQCADAGPLLRSLHWLPVKQRVAYKMATATQTYLSDLVHYSHLSLCKWSSLEPTPPSVLRLHLSGTLCLLYFDCAIALLHSNDT